MRMMNKIMTGMSIAAFALVAAGGMNAMEADAAGTAKFDAVNQTMTATTSAEKEVHVSFNAIKMVNKKNPDGTTARDENGKVIKEPALNAKATWDVYNGASAKVDLSNLKTTADVYIAVKDTTTAVPNVYFIPKNTVKYTGTYGVDAETSKSGLTFKIGKEVQNITSATLLEYQTVKASAWTAYAPTGKSAFSTTNLPMYEKQGATLYFRQKAATMENGAAVDKVDFKLITVSGNFAGTEFKVKIAKEASAPTATINYDKATFTVGTGKEYRQRQGASATWAPAQPPEGKKTETIQLTKTQLGKAGVFEVRTAATNKKVASKIRIYSFDAATAPSTELNIEANTTGAVVDPTVKYNADNKVNVYYNLSKTGVAQINFLNKTDIAYSVFKADPYDNPTERAVVVLPANATKPVVRTETVLKPGTELYFVKNSNKKAGVFRSLASAAKVVTYPTSPAMYATVKATTGVHPTALTVAEDGTVTPKDNKVSYYYDKYRTTNRMNFWNKTPDKVLIYKEDPNANPLAKVVATLPANATKVVTVSATKLPEVGQPLYIVKASDYANGKFRSKAVSSIKVTYPAS